MEASKESILISPDEVIARAARACINSGQDVDNHFHRSVKMVPIGSNIVRQIRDYKVEYGWFYGIGSKFISHHTN